MFRPTSVIRFGLAGLLALGVGFPAHGSPLRPDEPGGEKKEKKKAVEGEKSGSKQVRKRLDTLLKEHPEADQDQDGKLSPGEARDWLREHRPLPEGKRLEAFLKRNPGADRDQDGKLSREEFNTYLKDSEKSQRPPAVRERSEKLLKEHPEADQDQDGKLSVRELREWRRDNPPAPRKLRLPPPAPPRGRTPEKKTEEL